MSPYILSYLKERVDPDLDKGLAVWLTALALSLQGFFMPIGGILAKYVGFRIVVICSCLSLR